ncbi:MAG: phosphatase family protein, partial [Daejeonella sp.]|nr:phosphatase family protein [Daejeonella sp.]
AGWKLGEQVAKQIIEEAKNDGSAIVQKNEINTDPKKWTGPYPLGIALAKFKPMIMKSADQFRPLPPPDFAADMKELQDFKPTLQSSSLAYEWDNHGAGYWIEVASQKMFEYHLFDDTPAAARLFTVLTTASHDAGIAIMDAKYTYWGIRPDQYDKTFKPILNTPPFPGYPSGHAMSASVASSILGYFFPADAKQFQKLAQDCADSRFYGGIHFRTDNETALKMGKEIGNYMVETWMKK